MCQPVFPVRVEEVGRILLQRTENIECQKECTSAFPTGQMSNLRPCKGMRSLRVVIGYQVGNVTCSRSL